MDNFAIQISPELLELAQSPEIYAACEQIGKEFSLNLDQIGELDAEISDIIVGSSSAQNFTTNVGTRLAVDPAIAAQIAQRANDGIIKTIQEKIPTKAASANPHTDLERIGQFKVEKDGSDEINTPTTTFDQPTVTAGAAFPNEHGAYGRVAVPEPEETMAVPPDHLLGEHGVEPEFPPLPTNSSKIEPPVNLPSEAMDNPYFVPMPKPPVVSTPTPPKPATVARIITPPPLSQPPTKNVNLLRPEPLIVEPFTPPSEPVPPARPVITADVESFKAPIIPDKDALKVSPVSKVPGTRDPYRESAL